MASSRGRKRWFEVLKRTTGLDQGEPRPALDDAALWAAHERIAKSLSDADRLAERVTAASARQRTSFDATRERTLQVEGELRAVPHDLDELRSVAQKLEVLALNAGLEGARTADAHGRALTLLAEDIRAQLVRANDALHDLDARMSEVKHTVDDVIVKLDTQSKDVQELGQDANLLKAATSLGVAATAELELRLRKATGIDPAIAKLVAAAGDHAKGLLAALTNLDGAGASDAARSLAPTLAPVLRVLHSMGAELEVDSERTGG